MDNTQKTQVTPLWVIGAFLSFTEIVMTYALTKVDGATQVALLIFVILFDNSRNSLLLHPLEQTVRFLPTW